MRALGSRLTHRLDSAGHFPVLSLVISDFDLFLFDLTAVN